MLLNNKEYNNIYQLVKFVDNMKIKMQYNNEFIEKINESVKIIYKHIADLDSNINSIKIHSDNLEFSKELEHLKNDYCTILVQDQDMPLNENDIYDFNVFGLYIISNHKDSENTKLVDIIVYSNDNEELCSKLSDIQKLLK